MLQPSNFAVVGHDCKLIVEYPEAFSPDEKGANVGFFTMGASYTSQCMIAGLKADASYVKRANTARETLQNRDYHRTDVRRIRLVRSGDQNSCRLAIRSSERLRLYDKDLPVLGGRSAYTEWRLKAGVNVHTLVVYWNVDHVDDSNLGDLQGIRACLSACLQADILLFQLSATAEVLPKVVQDTISLIMEFIEKRNGKPSIIVTNSSSLDFLGLTLHRGSSWERFADDLCMEMMREPVSPLVELFRAADYVVVRGSDSATAVVRTDAARGGPPGSATKLKCSVYYPVAPRVVPLSHEAFLVGGTNLITSAIGSAIIEGGGDVAAVAVARYVRKGVVDGVKRNILFERRGYFDVARKHVDPMWHVSLVLEERNVKDDDEEMKIAVASVGDQPTWSLTQTRISASDNPKVNDILARLAESDRPLAHAAYVASYLVRNGVQRAAQEFHFPFAQLGDAFVVDRFEYEQYMEMQAVMRSYLQRKGADGRPLSLAVFGRPGAGKTFGIKQLPKTIGVQGLMAEPIEANVSQFETVDDLADKMHLARNAALKGEVPLVLWDEFDCEREGKPFGWFRYFLAPMQDGTFKQRQLTFDIRSAIFVFIGGVNHDFDMFNGRLRDQQFIQAKGPDFASRIRAHLDIKDISGSSDDLVYLLRRAVFLRGFLLKYHKGTVRERACDGRSGGSDRRCVSIAPEVLRAFLMVERYEHGVRSLEALVQMCTVSEGQSRLSWSALPSAEQMEGHVSAREFTAIGDDVMPRKLFAE